MKKLNYEVLFVFSQSAKYSPSCRTKIEPTFEPSRIADGRKASLTIKCWASQGPSRVFIARKKFHWFRTKLKQQVFRAGV